MTAPKRKPAGSIEAGGKLMLSSEARCLDSRSTELARSQKGRHVRRLRRDFSGGVEARTFLPVSFFGADQLADVVTGALYDARTGECLTSSALCLLPGAAPDRPGRASRRR